jgi:phosphoribosylformylglycinamidine synthase subunit PurL
VGLLGSGKKHMTLNFKQAGDLIYQIGTSKNDLGCSHYLAHFKQVAQSPAPYFNLDEEHQLHQSVLKLINAGLIQSAHDVSEGGLLTCLLESAMPNNLSFEVSKTSELRTDAFLFGEAQGRVVVSVDPKNQAAFEALLNGLNQGFEKLGTVSTGEVKVDSHSFGALSNYKTIFENSLEEQ